MSKALLFYFLPIVAATVAAVAASADKAVELQEMMVSAQGAYTAGDYTKAIELLEEVAFRNPSPLLEYNLCCIHAQVGNRNEALDHLDKAVELGFLNIDTIAGNPILNPLRKSSRYGRIIKKSEKLERARKRAIANVPDPVDILLPAAGVGGGRKAPLLVFLHGMGSSPQEIESIFTSFAEEGKYTVFLPSGSVKMPPRKDGHLAYNFDPVRDIRTILQKIDKIEGVDVDHVYISGFSAGANMSYVAAIEYPERFAGVLAFSGAVQKELFSSSMIRKAAGEVPIFIVHGKMDTIMPISLGRDAEAYFKENGFRVLLKEHDGAHFIPANYMDIIVEAVEWFSKENSARGDFDLAAIERPRILAKAERYLFEEPRTVTAASCERSKGGLHDYYSEGDYWWPDPENLEGPYIRRYGETTPEIFFAHRHAMVRLSEIIGTLTSAYLLTDEEKYAGQAVRHLKAWFVDEATRMNPSLLYGQAIMGRHTGRSIGIIDTLHLTEVARGAKLLCESPSFSSGDQQKVKGWFRDYLHWINSHPYGLKEKVHPNNHGVCWSLQAAAFADLTDDDEVLDWIRNQFKTVYLVEMMDQQGGFPAELRRTKPYGYSLFVIDAMAGVAQVASTGDDNLWSYQLPDGRGMQLGLAFIYPFISDKTLWPYARDIMYWDDWPVRHPSLLFGGLHYYKRDYLKTWKLLEADPEVFEIMRNLPLRHPLLWVTGRDVARGRSTD